LLSSLDDAKAVALYLSPPLHLHQSQTIATRNFLGVASCDHERE
jgi:hypothetical protein